jgi:hypothetical protein
MSWLTHLLIDVGAHEVVVEIDIQTWGRQDIAKSEGVSIEHTILTRAS